MSFNWKDCLVIMQLAQMHGPNRFPTGLAAPNGPNRVQMNWCEGKSPRGEVSGSIVATIFTFKNSDEKTVPRREPMGTQV